MKRFTETIKWDDAWFMGLKPTVKLLWIWLLDHCDNSGVIEFNAKLASFQIGETIDHKHLLELSSRLKTLPNGKLWIEKFIQFQYGKLGTESRPHLQVLSLIVSHGLTLPEHVASVKAIDSLRMGPKTGTRQDKDKEPDKDKEGVQGEKQPKHVPAHVPDERKSNPATPRPIASIPDETIRSLKLRVSGMFNRKEDDPWSYAEDCALLEVCRRPRCLNEWTEINTLRLTKAKYFSKSVQALLADWTKYLDRARVPEATDEPSGPPLINGSNSYTICPGNNGVMGV